MSVTPLAGARPLITRSKTALPAELAETVSGRAFTPPDPLAEKDAKLHKVAQQMEGSFVQQMYKAMRDTVPTGGLFDGGSGEEMFTGLLDEHVASDTPTHWQHGLSEAIYHQMRKALR